MKRFFALFGAVVFTAGLMAQADTTRVQEGNVTVIESEGMTTVKVGADDAVVVEEKEDTIKVKIGEKDIAIIEDEKGTRVDWDPEGEDKDEKSSKSGKFKPHWAGLEMGLNNYMNSDFSMSLDPAASFMDLNTSRSWNFNLNFMEYGIGFGTDKVGLVTGLGLEWMNFHFDGTGSIRKDANGVIEPYTPQYVTDGASVEKTKLQTTYLTAPLLLEFQIPAGKKRVFISGGVIGGVKLGSNAKVVYREDGNKQKEKKKDDFNLSSLRYGLTVRAGYRNLKLFANYYPVSLFEKDKGPELYPFAVGLTLLTF